MSRSTNWFPSARRRRASSRLLQRLADARLVTLDEGTAQVAHEALIREWPRLRGWLDADRAGARVHRELSRAAQSWDSGGREPSDLYRGARLAAARELPAGAQRDRARIRGGGRARSGPRTAPPARAAGRCVRPAAGRDRRRRAEPGPARQCARGRVRRRSPGLERRCRPRRRARVGEPTLERSLLLAATGVALEDRIETRGDLLTILQQNPAAVRTLRLSKVRVSAFTASPDGPLLASGDVDGVVRFTDLRTWKPNGADVKLPQPVSAQAMRFAPDGRTLAVGTGEETRSELYLVDVVTRRARRIGSWPGSMTSTCSRSSRWPSAPMAAASRSPWGTTPPTSLSRCFSVSSSSTAGPDVRCGVGATRAETARCRSSSCSAATAP